MIDYYKILGLTPDATDEEIKRAYRKLSKKFHPDVNQGDPYFEERFKEIKKAYDKLSDPAFREMHKKFHEKRFKPYATSAEKVQKDPSFLFEKIFVIVLLIGLIAIVDSLCN